MRTTTTQRVLVACVAALLTVSAVAVAVARTGRRSLGEGNDRSTLVAAGSDLAGLRWDDVTTTTTAPPPTTTTTAPPPATTAPRPTTPPTTRAPRPKVAAHAAALHVPALHPPAVPAGLVPYRGLGTWSDVYDWSRSYTNGQPATGPADVDRMADQGVQTLYIQASKADSPTDVVDPDLLQPILDRAQARGLHVVAWYLPTLTDPQRDLQRIAAIAALQHVDSISVDIESKEVQDVDERNRRLVDLSNAVRQALPGRTVGAIVLPPVVLEVVNPAYWPNFPYRAIAADYDVWLTMGYWTNRKQSSGYRDPYRYTRENVDRLRADIGATVPVHPVGGLGASTTAADVEAYRQAAIDTGSLGGSLYDWRTTAADCWTGLKQFRA